MKYALYKDHLYHALDATKIEQAYVSSGKHCLLRCVKNRVCFSANVAVVPAPDGRVLSCFRLTSTVHRKTLDRLTRFHHYSIAVSN